MTWRRFPMACTECGVLVVRGDDTHDGDDACPLRRLTGCVGVLTGVRGECGDYITLWHDDAPPVDEEDRLASMTPEWCVKTFHEVNPGAKMTNAAHMPSLYLVDFARAVVRFMESSSKK